MKSASNAVYRNGFIVSQSRLDPRRLGDGWTISDLHGWEIAAHPDTHVFSVDSPTCPVIAFGDAFFPDLNVFESEEAFRIMSRAMEQGEDEFHRMLDGMCGRFAIFVKSLNGWELYHDALGSRSVFYSLTQPIFASHVELLADIMRLRHGDYFIPFITSKNYIQRDVKYLPGAATPYDDLRQLTPNTALNMNGLQPRRYWPREDIEPHVDVDAASEALIDHLRGLSRFLTLNSIKPFLGLTGGTDSRALLAGLATISPKTFTWVRSVSGDSQFDKESRVAKELAEIAGVPHESFPVKSPARLNDAQDEISYAYRKNTGYYRGIDGGWQRHFFGVDYDESVFVRGFGGEILRGFYQGTSNQIKRVNARQLSNAYDVNSGSDITRRYFDEFIHTTDLTEERCFGYDPNDLFYWEHRMGTWGSIALTESDVSIRGMSGYNSRNLYKIYMSLDWGIRSRREPIYNAVSALSIALGAAPYI